MLRAMDLVKVWDMGASWFLGFGGVWGGGLLLVHDLGQGVKVSGNMQSRIGIESPLQFVHAIKWHR